MAGDAIFVDPTGARRRRTRWAIGGLAIPLIGFLLATVVGFYDGGLGSGGWNLSSVPIFSMEPETPPASGASADDPADRSAEEGVIVPGDAVTAVTRAEARTDQQPLPADLVPSAADLGTLARDDASPEPSPPGAPAGASAAPAPVSSPSSSPAAAPSSRPTEPGSTPSPAPDPTTPAPDPDPGPDDPDSPVDDPTDAGGSDDGGSDDGGSDGGSSDGAGQTS